MAPILHNGQALIVRCNPHFSGESCALITIHGNTVDSSLSPDNLAAMTTSARDRHTSPARYRFALMTLVTFCITVNASSLRDEQPTTLSSEVSKDQVKQENLSTGNGAIDQNSPARTNVLAESKPPSEGERLVANTPQDWIRIYQINNETTRLSDFVPPGENAANWTHKLSFEAYSADTLNIDPIELLLSEAAEDERQCNFVQHFNIFSGYENNYETSVRLFMCGENEFAQKGEIKLVKAIRGNQYIYSIRLTRRIPPFEIGQAAFGDDEMAKWSSYLNHILLCDDLPAHQCAALPQ